MGDCEKETVKWRSERRKAWGEGTGEEDRLREGLRGLGRRVRLSKSTHLLVTGEGETGEGEGIGKLIFLCKRNRSWKCSLVTTSCTYVRTIPMYLHTYVHV